MSSTNDIDRYQDAPDVIVPPQEPKKTFKERLAYAQHKLTTRDGLLGDYNYGMRFMATLWQNIP